MGVFLQTAMIQEGNTEKVRAVLRNIAGNNSEMNILPEECEYRNAENGTLLILNEHAAGYDILAEALSAELHLPVMLLYIYDDDEWGYYYYDNGEKLDLFSVYPSEEAGDMSGNPDLIARKFGVAVRDIIHYYKEWTDDLIESEEAAYEEDSFAYGDCWQMTDFMRKLGFPFPEGNGEAAEADSFPEGNGDSVEADRLPEGGENAAGTKEMLNDSGHQRKPVMAQVAKQFFEYDSIKNMTGAMDSEYKYQIIEEFGSQIKDALDMEACGQYRQARDVYTKKIDALKDNCDTDEKRRFLTCLYLLRGRCSRTVGNSWKAERDLDVAYELEPENVYILRERCPVAASKKRNKRVIVDLTALMRLDTAHYDDYLLDRAWRYYWVEDYDSARRDMQEVIERGIICGGGDYVKLREKLGMD